MLKKSIKDTILRNSIGGLAFGLSLILVMGVAFAFSTWAPGQVPQGNPANGNVQLASTCPSCPAGYNLNTTTNTCVAVETPGRAYGYCSDGSSTVCYNGGRSATCRSSSGCDSVGLIAPATCASVCGCLAGYTLKLTGTASGGDAPTTISTSWTTNYYTCIKS